MKNLLILFSLGLILASCSTEEMDDANQKEFLSFSKSMSVEDEQGNSVDLTIFANTQEAIDDHTQNTVHLVVGKQAYNSSSENSVELDIEESLDGDEKQNDFVYIHVNKFNFSEDVTSFTIQTNFDYSGRRTFSKYSESFYFYAYGADGVNGASVQYTDETRSKEYLTAKFSKKTAPSNWFWQTLSTGTMYNVGDDWDFCGSTTWNRFKLKVKVHKAKSGVCCYGFNWAFLINC